MLSILFTSASLLLLPFVSGNATSWAGVVAVLYLLAVISLGFYPMGMNQESMSNFFFFDGLNLPLVSLSFWICGLMVMASYKVLVNNESSNFFLFNLVSLSVILLICFFSSNMLIFYVFFELSVIPTMIMILVWGYQPERLQASLYFVIYTVSASLPLLISLGVLKFYNSSLFMPFLLWNSGIKLSVLWAWWLFTVMAFLIKLPLYGFHLWLPKAHVEAPVAGSMILAAVLLKLGGYGLIRLSCFFPELSLQMIPLISSVAMIGACASSFICLRQPDLKSMIAYSSVGHMGLMAVGILSCSLWGWFGALSVMVAHGLCSSGLFSMANMIYEYSGSRSLVMIKGLISIFPTMSVWWFFLCVANMSAPPSLNLFGEILLVGAVLKSSDFYSFFLLFQDF
uniref:NADH-ubiquinone oxidoreductase chain 4 n=1 Tax=Amphisamytha bioculata TaxID=1131436 RepID=A0A220T2X3_9ANNE|nr:NADH dehydrogenase subunit 4 [Amphisamytha bioculata]